jgi:hypothetical protein
VPTNTTAKAIAPTNVRPRDSFLNWWAQPSDPCTLGSLIHWPELEARHPEVAELPVIQMEPGQDTRWRSAAFVGKWTEGKFHPRSHIRINTTNKTLYPDPARALRSLLHEATHAIQCAQGRFTTHCHLECTGYSTNPLEKEARAMAAKTPGIPWPTHLLGPRKNFPYKTKGYQTGGQKNPPDREPENP